MPVGVPKTGFMIESMVTATARKYRRSLARRARPRPWNAVCLADFGDSIVAFVAEPQIPPRNINWASEGCGCTSLGRLRGKYFLRKMRRASEPFYEKFIMDRLGIRSTRRPSGLGVLRHDAEQPAVLGDEHSQARATHD